MFLPKQKFFKLPKWIKAYDSSQNSILNPQFHYCTPESERNQRINLYVCVDNGQIQPMTMYYNMNTELVEQIKEIDDSKIKDFSYLDYLEREEIQKINISKNELIKQSSWVRKYEPTRFTELLTDQLHNRNVLTWMKSWDEIVFHKKNHKIEQFSTIFNKANPKSTFIPHQYSYKKLILLAGPPGCGKTTLARVVANHCGYSYQQINASDDRSGKTLITKINNLVSNKTLRIDQKPVCVIIDEVDGALDSDSNGIKQVLHYIETGQSTILTEKTEKKKGAKDKSDKVEKNNDNNKFVRRDFKSNKPYNGAEKQQIIQKRRTKIDRPIIFICNDPYVKGLRDLRSKALIVYFNPLQEQRVIKRLKQITEKQNVYVETDILNKICQMCNRDIRSSVGLLELLIKQKQQSGISAKEIINRMNMSYSKDVHSSVNDFLATTMHTKDKTNIEKISFKLSQQENITLLNQYFYHNFIFSKNLFNRMQNVVKLYEIITQNDVIQQQSFKIQREGDSFATFPFLFYRLNFRGEDYKKLQFPSSFFERNNKIKANKAIVEKILSGMSPNLILKMNAKILIEEYLYLFYLCMQTSSHKEEEVLKCVYKMLTYGIKLNNRNSPFLFQPEFDQLLIFGGNKLEISLSNTSRNLIQENYQFLKMKSQLLSQYGGDVSKRMGQNIIMQLRKNKKKRLDSQEGGIVKYKFLQGTGTEVKYDLKLSYFFKTKVGA